MYNRLNVRLLAILLLGLININISAINPDYSVLDEVLSHGTYKSKGEIFKGQRIKKKRSGMGLLRMKNGDIYIGDFLDNKRHGSGILISDNPVAGCNSARTYVGRWIDDEISGKGILYDRFGIAIYRGSFENNLPLNDMTAIRDSIYYEQQFATYTLDDGAILIGQFVGDDTNGLAVIVFSNGDLLYGRYINDSFSGIGLWLYGDGEWETIKLDKNGDFSVISSSEYYRTINEAQKRAFQSSLSDVLGCFAQAANAGANLTSSIRRYQQGGYSTVDEAVFLSSDVASTSTSTSTSVDNLPSRSSYGSSSATESGPKNDLSEQRAYNTDKRTYAKYDGMLAEYFAGNRKASSSEKNRWQSEMKRLRKKWTSRGRDFPHFTNEDK